MCLFCPSDCCNRLTTALGVAILGGIKLANERRVADGNMAGEGVCIGVGRSLVERAEAAIGGGERETNPRLNP